MNYFLRPTASLVFTLLFSLPLSAQSLEGIEQRYRFSLCQKGRTCTPTASVRAMMGFWPTSFRKQLDVNALAMLYTHLKEERLSDFQDYEVALEAIDLAHISDTIEIIQKYGVPSFPNNPTYSDYAQTCRQILSVKKFQDFNSYRFKGTNIVESNTLKGVEDESIQNLRSHIGLYKNLNNPESFVIAGIQKPGWTWWHAVSILGYQDSPMGPALFISDPEYPNLVKVAFSTWKNWKFKWNDSILVTGVEKITNNEERLDSWKTYRTLCTEAEVIMREDKTIAPDSLLTFLEAQKDLTHRGDTAATEIINLNKLESEVTSIIRIIELNGGLNLNGLMTFLKGSSAKSYSDFAVYEVFHQLYYGHPNSLNKMIVKPLSLTIQEQERFIHAYTSQSILFKFGMYELVRHLSESGKDVCERLDWIAFSMLDYYEGLSSKPDLNILDPRECLLSDMQKTERIWTEMAGTIQGYFLIDNLIDYYRNYPEILLLFETQLLTSLLKSEQKKEFLAGLFYSSLHFEAAERLRFSKGHWRNIFGRAKSLKDSKQLIFEEEPWLNSDFQSKIIRSSVEY